MTWLVKLYPPAWRRRYGRELTQLIATQPMSVTTAIDLVAGAIDAWMRPQSSAAVSVTSGTEGATMLAKMMQLRCAGHGPTVTSADVWKSLMVTLGGTVVLTLFWIWANRRFAQNPYIDALGLMAYSGPDPRGPSLHLAQRAPVARTGHLHPRLECDSARDLADCRVAQRSSLARSPRPMQLNTWIRIPE